MIPSHAGLRRMAQPAILTLLFLMLSAGPKGSGGKMSVSNLPASRPSQTNGATFEIIRGAKVEIAQLQVADMNHDGELDLISVGQFDRSLKIHIGRGDGTFADPLFAGALVNDFHIGYANSDTLRDIIAVKTGLGELVTLINNGGGTFTKIISQIGAISARPSLTVGFLDDNAHLDYLIAPRLLVFGDGAGGIDSTTTIPLDFQTANVADLDGDGDQDLIITNLDTLALLINDGSGVFTISSVAYLGLAALDTLGATTQNGLSDLNRDGQIDIVAVQPYAPTADSTRITIAFGDGAGGVTDLSTYIVAGTIHHLSIADADGDGHLDIVGSNPGGMDELTFLRGDGSGSFVLLPGVNVGETGRYIALGKGDFNDDGNIDFVSGCFGVSCSLIVALNNNPPLPIICGNMTVYGLSNIEMSVIDPAGNMISAMYTTVAGGSHELIDEDLDGVLDNRISNISLMDGEYILTYKLRYPDKPPGTFSSLIRVPFREFKFFKDYPAPLPGDSIVFHHIQEYSPRTLPRSGEKIVDVTPRIIWWDFAADASQLPPFHFQLDNDYDFSSPLITDTTLTEAAYEVGLSLENGAYYYWRYRARTEDGWGEFSNPFAFHVEPVCCDDPGDSNNDGRVNIADVTFLISWIFVGSNAPPCSAQADANGDQKINIGDITYIIARIFANGPAPLCG